MKIKVQNYSFDKTAKQVTFTDYNPIDLAGVLLIVNQTYQNIIIYNFADVTKGGTAATNVLTLTYDTAAMANTDKLLIYYDDGLQQTVKITAVKAVEQATDWTSVAQNTVVASGVFDCSLHVASHLAIQAFLTTETAHLGTEFIVQVSSNTTGNEDWCEWCRFVAMIGTANSEAVTNNPLNAAGTSITCVSTTGYTVGLLAAIKDATLINSELFTITVVTANTSLTILDGVTNAHANTAVLYNIAINQVVMLAPSVIRARVVVNNGYSPSGSTLAYKLRLSKATSL
jgi:hypothetical protein